MQELIRPYNYSTFRPSAYAHGSMQKTKNTSKKQDAQINKTLEGVIVNTYIKDKEASAEKTNMDDICNNLIIPNDFRVHPILEDVQNEPDDTKEKDKRSLLKSSLPYVAGALIATGMALVLSNSYVKSQKLLKPGNVPDGIKLPVVGKNINLKSEEYFAIYMALSEPTSRNILALGGVFAMSALTYAGKTFIDGMKKVWVKKQEADIKKDFEEKSIEIETKSFAGKLDVVRQELVEKANYFKSHIKDDKQTVKSYPPVFGKFISFTGNADKKNAINTYKKSFKETLKSAYDKFKDSPVALGAVSALTLGAMVLGGRKVFKNIANGVKIKNQTINANNEKIEQSIQALIEKIKNAANDAARESQISKLKEKLFSIKAPSDKINEVFSQIGFDEQAVSKVSKEISDAIGGLQRFGKPFYVQADPAMGGKEGTQFYIYIDQAKGYIYDVITHPENKFARYLFSAITAAGAAGYTMKESVDALKERAVLKENANTELELQRRLVDTEIRNFKSKKQSAIEPMMLEFNTKLKEGKSKEELKTMADNILLEIKNGPPFVYA